MAEGRLRPELDMWQPYINNNDEPGNADLMKHAELGWLFVLRSLYNASHD
jgi:hypothetical protein